MHTAQIPTYIKKELKVTFKHERGIDVDGLWCEVVNCFWDNFETTFMNGNTEKVPQVLPTSLPNFYHIGRFISHAYVLTPVNLSIVFSKIIVCSEETYIYDDQLLSSTLHFVDNLSDLLSQAGRYAHIEKPFYALCEMRKGMLSAHPMLWTRCTDPSLTQSTYEMLVPTTSRVWEIINEPGILNKNEEHNYV